MAVNGGLFEYAGKAARETKNAINAENELAKGRIQVGGVWYDSIGDYLKNKPSSNQGETDEEVINAVGTVDNQNTITLANNLPNDTYTLKYENKNGVLQNYKEICTLTVTADNGTRVYDDLIAENCAPVEATIIGVYNSSNERVGDIALGHLGTNLGNKLYSFGALADIHLQYETATDDFQKALNYLNTIEDVDFIYAGGDLTTDGTAEELAVYKYYVDTYSPETPVYTSAGNHESNLNKISNELLETYTGFPLYYSFTHGNDVFIMMGLSDTIGFIFTDEELQWLYEVLEANKDKRCFVFQHVRSNNTSGNSFGLYDYDIWEGRETKVFESLMKHYPNITWFHGHSHNKFYLQYGADDANYENSLGYHSVHIPSISVPRDGDITGPSSSHYSFEDSEGYIVDVYENGVILRGRDFANEQFLPIAQYYLDTTLKIVEANTYKDSTGTIITSDNPVTNVLLTATDSAGNIYNNQGWKSGTRLNSSGEEKLYDEIETTGFIPVKLGDVIRLKNVTIKTLGTDKYTYASPTYFAVYDSDKNCLLSMNLGYLYLGSTGTVGYGLTLDDALGNIIEIRTDEMHNPGITGTTVDWRFEDMAYFRFSCEEITNDSIITINQRIW